MNDTEKALNYYRAAAQNRRPDFVPSRIRLNQSVKGDGWCASTRAHAGDHDCTCNRWGAASVKATDGKALGIKISEFEALEWRPNPL